MLYRTSPRAYLLNLRRLLRWLRTTGPSRMAINNFQRSASQRWILIRYTHLWLKTWSQLFNQWRGWKSKRRCQHLLRRLQVPASRAWSHQTEPRGLLPTFRRESSLLSYHPTSLRNLVSLNQKSLRSSKPRLSTMESNLEATGSLLIQRATRTLSKKWIESVQTISRTWARMSCSCWAPITWTRSSPLSKPTTKQSSWSR